MTNPERAQQLWSLLVLAARNQQVLSYEMIGQMTGVAQDGSWWSARFHLLVLPRP